MARGTYTDSLPAGPPAGPPAGAPPAAAPAGAPPDANSVEYKQQQFLNSIQGLTPDKAGNLVNPQTGQIAMPWGQLETAVWSGAVDPTKLPKGPGVDYSTINWEQVTGHAPGSLVPVGNGAYAETRKDGTTYIIAPDGSLYNKDGSPAIDPATGKPGRDPYMGFAVDNATNVPIKDPLGSVITDTLNTVQDQITKGNPVAGMVRAGVDLVTGHTDKVTGDLVNGTSFGVANVDDKGSLTTGTTVNDVGNTAKDAGLAVPNIPGLGSLGDLLKPGASVDSSAAKSDHDRAMSLADSLSSQANTAGQTAAADRGQTDQTRAQQEDSIAGLQAAASGAVPSAAEIQGRNQASIDAARQYGLAAALQGNNPAAALRQASLGSAAVAGTNNANAAALRATEQANARNALASTLGNVRAADTGQQTTDIGQQTNLNNASATQSGQGITSTGQQITAQTEKQKADAAKTGALLGAGGTVLSTILSDPKAKKNIKAVGLADALGKGVTGVKYTYVSPEDGPGEQFGILADELEKVIPSTVKRRGDGMRVVDTGRLSLSNTAILSELAKRIMELEKKGGRK